MKIQQCFHDCYWPVFKILPYIGNISHFHLLVNVSMFSLSKQTVYLFFFCFLCREKPPVKEARRPPAPPSWLQRDLKVRFIDKAFKGGRYYNSKVLICHRDITWSSKRPFVVLTQTSFGSWNFYVVIKRYILNQDTVWNSPGFFYPVTFTHFSLDGAYLCLVIFD